MIVAICRGGEEVEIPDEFVSEMDFFKNALEGEERVQGERIPIPVPIIARETLQKVLDFYKLKSSVTDFTLPKFPIESTDIQKLFPGPVAEFLVGLGKAALIQITNAADFLNCEFLNQVVAIVFATHIKSRTPEYIKEFFQIEEVEQTS
jgi:hypothetical protein